MVEIQRPEHYKDFADITRSYFVAGNPGSICILLYEVEHERNKQLKYLEMVWTQVFSIQSERIKVRSGASERLVSEIEELSQNAVRAISVLGIPTLPDDQFVALACSLNARRERIRKDGVIVMFWLTPTRLPGFVQQAPDLMSIAQVYALSDERYTISKDLIEGEIKRLEEKYDTTTFQFLQQWAKGQHDQLGMSEDDERLWLLLAEAIRREVDGTEPVRQTA